MVAGYHDGCYARAAAFFDCRLDLRADGVNHARESDKDKIMLQRLGQKIVGRGVVFFHRRRKHAQRLICHSLIFRGYIRSNLIRHGDGLSVNKSVGTQIDNNIGCALCVLNNTVCRLVNGGHHLPARVKRGFADSRAV